MPLITIKVWAITSVFLFTTDRSVFKGLIQSSNCRLIRDIEGKLVSKRSKHSTATTIMDKSISKVLVL